jgi:hypothetical protein
MFKIILNSKYNGMNYLKQVKEDNQKLINLINLDKRLQTNYT